MACPARGRKSRNISTNTYGQDKRGVCACLVKHFPAAVTRRICDPLTVTSTMWTHSSKQHAACERTVCPTSSNLERNRIFPALISFFVTEMTEKRRLYRHLMQPRWLLRMFIRLFEQIVQKCVQKHTLLSHFLC